MANGLTKIKKSLDLDIIIPMGLSKVNCIVIPLVNSLKGFTKPQSQFWLWNAWRPSEQAVASGALRRWRDGFNLEDKMEIMNQNLSNTMYQKFITEWKKLEVAPQSSLKGKWYKFIQLILSREDPRESFLKSVPTDGGVLDVSYPDIFEEKLVRRRLRLIARQGRAIHRRGLILWSLAFIPQMPLMITPLPNITVYYTLYRIWSHSRALKGSFVLDHGFSALDALQLVKLREALLEYQNSTGIVYEHDSWPHKLVTGDRTYREFFNQVLITHNKRRLERRLSKMLQKSSTSATKEDMSEEAIKPVETVPPPGHFEVLDTGLHLYFAPDAELSTMIQPGMVTDEQAEKIMEHFGVTNLKENIARAKLYLTK